MVDAITSVELNHIILRYFKESGFEHTAFMFDSEARVSNAPFNGDSIPPAILVALVQKGLQYMEMEENLKQGEESDEDREFRLLSAMDLIKKAGYKEQKIETNEEKNQHPNKSAKSRRKGKLRNARKREEARRKALEKEEADRRAREKEEADRRAREKEEADRRAREKEEADRWAREKEEADRQAREKVEANRVQRSRFRRNKVVFRIR